MDTAPLKAFATKARIDLLKQVRARADVALAPNSVARVESFGAIKALEDAIARDGREAVVDRVAYTWFNRIVALRFMDANGYTPSGVVSPEAGKATGQPEILAEAKSGVFDSAVVPPKMQETITSLLNLTRPSPDPQGEAYGLLLESYCRSWHRAMPFMFEQAGGYTELLMPSALLATDSVLARAQAVLTEEACHDSGDGNGGVEVVGWLYQFYISERKEEVFAGFKNNKKAGAAEIPAATQLFTPHWIVRYLVENSLGRLWLLNRPSSKLADRMAYYIEPVDGATDFLRVSSPEELKILDPAVGSGHMLTYAFDLLYEIYEEEGYAPADIPGLILEHNLHGVEIDTRAGALASFALTMKAANRRKTFLKSPVQPNVCILRNIHFDQGELDYLWSLTTKVSVARTDADEFWNAFEHADTFGSLIQPKETLIPLLRGGVDAADVEGDLLQAVTLRKAATVIDQAECLSQRYSVVVANPPYMGSGNMSSALAEFAKSRYAMTKNDLFAMFIERSAQLVSPRALIALVAMQSWMFLSGFEKLREHLLGRGTIRTLAHLGSGAFESLAGEVVATSAFVYERDAEGSGVFVRLTDVSPAAMKGRVLADASRRAEHSYVRDSTYLRTLPGSLVIYWFPDELGALFKEHPPIRSRFAPMNGMTTGANAKFVRYWWEVSRGRTSLNSTSEKDALHSGARWFPYNKGGGGARRWFGNAEHVVDWERSGRRIEEYGHAFLRGRKNYFRPMITWSKINAGRPGFRLLPAGFLFDVAGMGLFSSASDDESALLRLLGFLNSDVAVNVLAGLSPTLNVESGQVGAVPLPDLAPIDPAVVRELVDLQEREWNQAETAWGFETLVLIPAGEARLSDCIAMRSEAETQRRTRVAQLELQNQAAVLTMLGWEPTQLHADRSNNALDVRRAVEELVSYAVGSMFGRYSPDEPGLTLADQGSTLQEYRGRITAPSFLPDKDNVIPIVDGEWFEDDIVAKFRQFLRVAFGEEHFEENLKFVVNSLGVKDLRDYFVKSFYKDHVQRYKKRPIYWLFSSPKGSFNALIYLHRYDPSTVSTVLNDYLHSYVNKLEANLQHQERVASGIGGVSARESATAQKEGDRIRKVLVELRDYEHDVLYPLAQQQVALDLDDGVLVNYQKLGAALRDIGLKKGAGGE